MSIDQDAEERNRAEPRPARSSSWLRRRLWWLLPEVLVLAGLAASTLFLPGTDLQSRLADRVAEILEGISPAEHHQHGHEVVAADRVICAAEVFGFEPADATSPAQVREVYAYYLCAAGEPGQPWDFAARISGPVAVSLTGPPAVRIAEAGLGYPDRVRAIIPLRYQDRAFAGFRDQDLPAGVLRRYVAEVAGAAAAGTAGS